MEGTKKHYTLEGLISKRKELKKELEKIEKQIKENYLDELKDLLEEKNPNVSSFNFKPTNVMDSIQYYI